MSMRHSVVLELKRCRGCTTCIKCCPTEAIRVRGRKATILPDRCIDCGSCIRICPHKAIKSVGDSLDILKQYQYCVAPAGARPVWAVPAPGQRGYCAQRPVEDRLSQGL